VPINIVFIEHFYLNNFIKQSFILRAMTWEIKTIKKLAVKYNNPVLIIGLPGIASVGKIAIDYLSEELKSEKIAEFVSDKGPGFTIISDKNLVIIPKIELKYINQNKRDFFFLTGDYQPVNNSELQSLCRILIDFTKKLGIKQIITLGGIGLEEEPEKPKEDEFNFI
jgi:proteasome assembly chaperone (PAC2) family protein